MRGILVVLAIIACCEADPGIIKDESNDLRIAPYHAMISANYMSFCGGALLNKRFVITTISACQLKPELLLTVRLGLNGGNDPLGIPVVATYLHEKYYPHEWQTIFKTYSYDLAILELARDVTFDETIQPIALPKQDEEIKDGMVFQALKEIDREYPPYVVFKYVNATHINEDDCRKAFVKNAVITSDMLCVSNVMLNNENRYNYGNALVFNETLMGVLSSGFMVYPNIYAGIPKVVDWINKIIN